MAENRITLRSLTNLLNLPGFATTRITFLAQWGREEIDGGAPASRVTRNSLSFTLSILLPRGVVFYLSPVVAAIARSHETQGQEARCHLASA